MKSSVAEIAVKFFEFFDIELDLWREDPSEVIERLLPDDFPAIMGRTVLRQLQPYRESNKAIRYSYDRIAQEVDELERDVEARDAGKNEMGSEVITDQVVDVGLGTVHEGYNESEGQITARGLHEMTFGGFFGSDVGEEDEDELLEYVSSAAKNISPSTSGYPNIAQVHQPPSSAESLM